MSKHLFYGVLLILLGMKAYSQDAVNSDTAMRMEPFKKKDIAYHNIIDCDYKISPEISHIDSDIILNWAEHAAILSFNLNFASIESQLNQLHSCYTEKGWGQLQNALRKSNNIETIKTEKLAVKGYRDGEAQIIEALDNRWKIILPLKVVYENDKKRVTHFLNIYLTIGWKNKDSLGIMQMIAIPRLAPLAQKVTPADEVIKSMSIILAERKKTSLDAARKITASFFVPLFSIHGERSQRNLTLSSRTTQRMAIIQPMPNLMPLNSTQNLVRRPSFDVPESAKIPSLALSQQRPLVNDVDSNKITLNDFSNKGQKFYPNWLKQIGLHSSGLSLNSLISQINRLPLWRTFSQYQQSIREPSDNMEAIKNQKPILSAQIEGEPQFIEVKENQWGIKLPIKVVYQKDKERITEHLDVHLALNQKMVNNLVVKNKSIDSSGVLQSLTSLQLSPQLFLDSQNSQLKQPEQSQSKETISCHYKIPAATIKTDKNIILRWAEHAATQSFAFDFTSIESQLSRLQSCYTENGWVEFNSAMIKSGNIEAIKMQRLNMTSEINGVAEFIETRENHWVIALPLKVTYKNDTMRVSQLLNLQLTVARKTNGELGVMQLIATLDPSSSPP
ncbi:DotI/IcmL family type IV secretion protein [Legionella pneumophila]|uniref:IcmL-like protein n=1 Tax=Legionella pneumophila subsp. pascullei TaxID=91890 RepID=A0AAX2IXC6_LEGPN|nr:DotI/IcmL family type IV secretion protein [Legionella pneumophila]AMP89242.1 type IV secretion protein IcmL [Legionella pneumophila subsp. pascullei]AMP93090.1 type IV secretion protein IcmL [Legionella pneumophila subsp. pascullei]AMP96056.1 type IV secretion protein IcmL [Legionella pneumophila subsp. pascullei]SQG90995.1 IcmL-like protein [Legionella pneumophila subsp. pascullei]VEH07540.1 IcmL-like protein [Legionella pneumophila subsp. pascullei]